MSPTGNSISPPSGGRTSQPSSSTPTKTETVDHPAQWQRLTSAIKNNHDSIRSVISPSSTYPQLAANPTRAIPTIFSTIRKLVDLRKDRDALHDSITILETCLDRIRDARQKVDEITAIDILTVLGSATSLSYKALDDIRYKGDWTGVLTDILNRGRVDAFESLMSDLHTQAKEGTKPETKSIIAEALQVAERLCTAITANKNDQAQVTSSKGLQHAYRPRCTGEEVGATGSYLNDMKSGKQSESAVDDLKGMSDQTVSSLPSHSDGDLLNDGDREIYDMVVALRNAYRPDSDIVSEGSSLITLVSTAVTNPVHISHILKKASLRSALCEQDYYASQIPGYFEVLKSDIASARSRQQAVELPGAREPPTIQTLCSQGELGKMANMIDAVSDEVFHQSSLPGITDEQFEFMTKLHNLSELSKPSPNLRAALLSLPSVEIGGCRQEGQGGTGRESAEYTKEQVSFGNVKDEDVSG